MTQEPERAPMRTSGSQGPVYVGNRQPAPQSLADVLERVLDKGIVIVGDIQVRLLDIELLTIKVRLMVASVDRAREMGINWWEGDPFVSNLADVLERVLDKGIVIVGDIQVRLLDIELLTIKLRLMVASVERAKEMGINWWEGDPFVTSLDEGSDGKGDTAALERRIDELEDRLLKALEPRRDATGESGDGGS